jgi:hypothetical protein
MSYRRLIQLKKLKDKVSKRYFVKIRFYHKSNFLFENSYDIHDLILENGWERISFGESMEVFKNLFDIVTNDYPIEKNQNLFWCIKEEYGYSISLKDEDLAKIRDKKIEDLGL